MSAARDPLCLVDGSGILFRAFHALPPLTTRQGLPTGAVFGVTSMLTKLRREQPDSQVIVVFDLPGKTFRDEVFAEYKAGRSETPSDLKRQIPYVKKIVRALGFPVLEVEGVEADDVIGTLTTTAVADGRSVDIVTSDKDMMQLVGPTVRLIDTMKNRVTEAEGVREKFGVGPENVIEVMGLMGDAIDNVPGVKGVGEKTAKRLMEHFGTIAAMYDRLGEIDDLGLRGAAGIKKKLEAGRNDAETSRFLVTIKCDVDLGVPEDSLRLRAPDLETLSDLSRELELHSLLKGYLADEPPEPATPVRETRHAEPEEVTRLLAAGGVALGVASGDTARVGARRQVVATAVGAPGSEEILVCDGMPEGLADALAGRAAHEVCVGDLKAALHACGLDGEGADAGDGAIADTLLLSYVLDPSRRGHGIDALAKERLGQELPADGAGEGEPAARAAAVANAVLELAPGLEDEVQALGLHGLYADMELPVARVLATMEQRGIRVDAAVLERAADEFSATAARLEKEIHDLAGGPFKINSTLQLRKVLFERLELPTKGVKKGKTGLSVNADVLAMLADKHPLPAKVVEHRGLTKLLSTYVTGLLPLIDPETGRVHTSFNQAVAATGRLSSSDPNLQNIPVRTAEGRRIREAFVPADGHLFLAADYSQIELRVLAHLTEDPVLLAAFRGGEDIHRRTASEVFDVGGADVTPEMRSRAKVINFGILYGMGAHRLSGELGIPMGEAAAYIERYFERYAKVKDFVDRVVAKGREDGYVETLAGRRRNLPDLTSREQGKRQAAERMAWNSPIQGTAADIIKLAMLAVDQKLTEIESSAKMLLQVHDELLFEVPEAEMKAIGKIVQECMESVVEFAVPLVVDLKSGSNWALLK
ncbi:MAG: DNA polymerase I [Candidatus Binatia bacterium]|nr:DNA polymerase I [Candidatus Binatia bacterium]